MKIRIIDLGKQIEDPHDTFNTFFSIINLECFELIFRNWVKQGCHKIKGVKLTDISLKVAGTINS